MSTYLTFVIPEPPAPKLRARITVRQGRVHGYTPTPTAQAEWRIRQHVEAQLGPDWTPLSGPLSLSVAACLAMPKRVPQRDRASARPIRRPDLDQYLKLVMDALSSARVWEDDAQVVSIRAIKAYSERPQWVIDVEEECGRPGMRRRDEWDIR